MKVIDDKISSISVSSENSNWAKENLRDDYTLNPWKPEDEVQTATITINMPSNCDSVYFGFTNADSATITIKETNDDVIETYEVDLTVYNYRDFIMQDQTNFSRRHWQSYTYQEDNEHKITIELTTSEDTLELGIVRAGFSEKFKNPNLGFREGVKDLSIVQELRSGGRYVVERNKIRTFSGAFHMYSNSDLLYFRELVFDFLNKPLAWNLYDNEQEGVVFAFLSSSPNFSRGSSNNVTAQISLTEVV